MSTVTKLSTTKRIRGKDALKQRLGAKGDLSLVDLDHVVPKVVGGTYDEENLRLLDPQAHMKRHGTLRERGPVLAEIKAVLDDHDQTTRLVLKVNNQLKAYQRRTDNLNPETEKFLVEQRGVCQVRLNAVDRKLHRLMQEYAKVDPLTAAVLSVPFVGVVTAAKLTVYVDLNKAKSASSLNRYIGIDKPAHRRYELEPGADPEKGRGGNKTLRTALYSMAGAMWAGSKKSKNGMRTISAYRIVGDRVKARLEVSEKIVTSRNTWGDLVEVAWRDTMPSHRHDTAIRIMIKHFLADYWFVGRTIMGLPTRPPYVQEKLGHLNIVQPQERGWKW